MIADADLYRLAGGMCAEAYTNRVDLGTTEYLSRIVDNKGQAVQMLAIPGTDEPLDWIKNFDMRSRHGIKKAAFDAANEIKKHFKPVLGIPLVVTGHSKGGATALAYTRMFHADYCVAFCPARCFRYTIKRYLKNATIFMDPDDIVPKIGFLNFGHPYCEWIYLPDDFQGIKISDHFMDHINEFLTNYESKFK